jgi:acetoin utilization deacetylase AcuC-like enzyme
LAPRVAAVLEGGYNLETLPALVESALRGFD